jgi:hypothetical protein
MSRRFLLVAGLLGALPVAGQAQDDPLKARCSQLYAMADRALSRRGEGGGGPNMIVQGAGIDCQKGRYEQGIRDLEKVLRSQGYTVPPAN